MERPRGRSWEVGGAAMYRELNFEQRREADDGKRGRKPAQRRG